MRPTCCGRNATPYRRSYGERGWESGLRCKACGAIRLPYFAQWDRSYMDAMEGVRQAGLEFDSSFGLTAVVDP